VTNANVEEESPWCCFSRETQRKLRNGIAAVSLASIRDVDVNVVDDDDGCKVPTEEQKVATPVRYCRVKEGERN